MIEVFSTCPPSSHVARARYLEYVADVARWSERAGCAGMFVGSDNRLVDPWMLSHVIVQHTTTLCPLVAVQPGYMHPYWVAKQITSFGYLYGRRLMLNMVAGGFDTDREALNDTTPRDLRCARLIEYSAIVMRLVETGGPLTFDGAFYQCVKLTLTPPLSKALVPALFVSGSSDAADVADTAHRAAKTMGATAVTCARPASEETRPSKDVARRGIRVGIIARDRSDHAWMIARSRFPADRRDRWTRAAEERSPYWLAPLEHHHTMCPYLVGSYETVAYELGRYLSCGYRTFILDVPSDPEELEHVNLAFAQAQMAAVAVGA